MSSVVVADSGCDLPDDFLAQRGIQILPLNITLEDKHFTDNIGSAERKAIYDQQLIDKGKHAETEPATEDQIKAFVLEKLANDYDYAVFQAIMRERSPTYENVLSVSQRIHADVQKVRAESGRTTPFRMRAFSTGTLFAGQGVMAAHTPDLLASGHDKGHLRIALDEFKPQVRAFAAMPDLAYIRERARKKGDKSVGLLASIMGKALDICPIVAGSNEKTELVGKVRGFDNAVSRLLEYAKDRVEEGLTAPYVVISVAGDPNILREYDRFLPLVEAAKKTGVQVLPCVMNLSGGINLGPGTVLISLASANDHHNFG